VADEEQKDEENQETGAGKSSKKAIIIIVIAVILAIGLSVGATVYFLGSGEDSDVPEEVSEEDLTPIEKGPAIYLDVKPPFLVTFNVEGRQRYMQIYVSVSSRIQSALDVMEYHMPLIRSKLITTYSDQNFEELQTPEGKRSLQSQTLKVINDVLDNEGSKGIEGVYFTNFVLQ